MLFFFYPDSTYACLRALQPRVFCSPLQWRSINLPCFYSPSAFLLATTAAGIDCIAMADIQGGGLQKTSPSAKRDNQAKEPTKPSSSEQVNMDIRDFPMQDTTNTPTE